MNRKSQHFTIKVCKTYETVVTVLQSATETACLKHELRRCQSFAATPRQRPSFTSLQQRQRRQRDTKWSSEVLSATERTTVHTEGVFSDRLFRNVLYELAVKKE